MFVDNHSLTSIEINPTKYVITNLPKVVIYYQQTNKNLFSSNAIYFIKMKLAIVLSGFAHSIIKWNQKGRKEKEVHKKKGKMTTSVSLKLHHLSYRFLPLFAYPIFFLLYYNQKQNKNSVFVTCISLVRYLFLFIFLFCFAIVNPPLNKHPPTHWFLRVHTHINKHAHTHTHTHICTYKNVKTHKDLQGAGHNISTATIVQLRVSKWKWICGILCCPPCLHFCSCSLSQHSFFALSFTYFLLVSFLPFPAPSGNFFSLSPSHTFLFFFFHSFILVLCVVLRKISTFSSLSWCASFCISFSTSHWPHHRHCCYYSA